MEDETVNGQDVLNRILHREEAPEATPAAEETVPAKVEAGTCVNCANGGVTTKLEDGVCKTCGYSEK